MLCFQKLINCWQRFCPAAQEASRRPSQTSLDHSAWPEEWFTKAFPERSSPLCQGINLISSVCMYVCVHAQYFTQLNFAVISLGSVFPLQGLPGFVALWGAGMLHFLLQVLLPLTLFDLKYQGSYSEELNHPFPEVVVRTPQTHSLHFTKQVLPSVWGRILIKI